MFAKLSCQKEEEEEGRNHNWNALDKQERDWSIYLGGNYRFIESYLSVKVGIKGAR